MAYDVINNPSHYNEGREIEPINVVIDWGLDFCLGSALKYIARSGRKESAITDLEKAKWFIEKKISLLKEGR